MSRFYRHHVVRAGLCTAAALVSTLALPSAQTAPDWVARSNAHTRVVLEAQAKLAPEGAAQVGVSGVDDQITDLGPGYTLRIRESITRTQDELQRRLKAEKDPLVRQDLEILLDALRQQLHGLDVTERRLAAMVEHGVSQARAIFAFNSTNVEGWGLYAERFNPLGFHDFVLAQGLLPPQLLRKAVMEDYVAGANR